jgi:hypothetical protein
VAAWSKYTLTGCNLPGKADMPTPEAGRATTL